MPFVKVKMVRCYFCGVIAVAKTPISNCSALLFDHIVEVPPPQYPFERDTA